MKAEKWGLATHIRVYDAGIFEFAKGAPQHTLLLGKKISQQQLAQLDHGAPGFKQRCLPPSIFLEEMALDDYQVIDLRDIEQRQQFPLDLPNLQTYLLDRFRTLITAKSRRIPHHNLLIIDNVGKQVRSLDYILQAQGFRNYYFLNGGILQWQIDGFDGQGRLNSDEACL